ncbi:Glycosyl transferase, family 2 (fragment) [Desulfamplus magnetovallimortis]|uniref:Glycosyl transferase, family 2 n=1 Tax=Desulfamplus magnetovallimortis TaxID=1246637 RepID=A0A1W1HBS9_9BACT
MIQHYTYQEKVYTLLKKSSLFSESYYLNTYSDVAAARVDPLKHYIKYGASEGRNPSLLFNTAFYLEQNQDVKHSGMNPLLHYILYGKAESRLPLPAESPIVDDEIKQLTNFITAPGNLYEEATKLSYSCHHKPDATIIIPVFNNIRYTLNCLKAIHNQNTTFTFEILIIDDNSSDETKEILSLIKGIKNLSNKKNKGFLLSCNKASKHSNGKYLVFLNNDAAPGSQWLQEILIPFKSHKNVGLVGTMLLFPDGSLQEAGGFVFKDGSILNYGRNGNPIHCRFNFVRETDYCSGCSIAIPKQLWNRIGGFDERYKPAYYEDTDLAFRVRDMGYKTIYTPFSKIVHFEGISCGISLKENIKKYQLINKPIFKNRWHQELAKIDKTKPSQLSVWKPYKNKTLLWIDERTPTPDKDSGSLDAFNFMKTACEDNWGITFLPLKNQNHAGQYTENLQRLGIECWYQPFIKKTTQYLKQYGSQFDLVILSRVTVAAPLIDDVKKYAPQAKIVFNTVDLHFIRHSREMELNISNYNQIHIDKLKESELAVVKKSDLTILISENEAKIVKKHCPTAKLAVIPIIRDIPGTIHSFKNRKDICFLGGFSHPPNVDAVIYFTHNVWPLVKAKLPGCKFIIAGSDMPDSIKRLASEDIVIKGYVPELHSLFEKVKLSVAPLRYGAGIKGKIVSSMSHGVPVICTTIAAEGMGLSNIINVSIADSPTELCKSICELYNSEKLWDSISKAGIKKTYECFSINSVSPIITETLNSIIHSQK